jgi:triosephosphate isomerase (TIM)
MAASRSHGRRPFVAGNWKLNGSRSANRQLLDSLLLGQIPTSVDVAVCPPFVYLGDAVARTAGTTVAVGAQNLALHDSGAFTGEVSASMLRDIGCSHVIIGHSERRTLFDETDADTAVKLGRALAAGLVPILCVGETLAQREAGATDAVVTRQLDAVLAVHSPSVLRTAIVAYEPVWAIGTGQTATPEQAQEVHARIRGRLAQADATMGSAVRILYGGSVKSSNARELFSMPDIDGGLIGGASLDAAEFARICMAAGT